MKYIRNTGRYGVAFVIVKNNREVKIELDKRRIYMDTGNIATDGITAVEEADIKELEKQNYFKTLVKAGTLEILDEEAVKTPEENKIKTLEKENKELQKKLKEAEKADVKKVEAEKEKIEAEKEKIEEENASLKAQLEALTKKAEDTPDGF